MRYSKKKKPCPICLRLPRHRLPPPEKNRRSMAAYSSRFLSKINLPPFNSELYKGQSGRIGILGGCQEYTGAPYYAAMTALRMGCDLAHVFCDQHTATVIKSYSPDLIVHPYIKGTNDKISSSIELNEEEALSVQKITSVFPRLHALLVGPGLGRDPKMLNVAKSVIEIALKHYSLLVVLDADALFLLQQSPAIIECNPRNVVLTPNRMEFKRLCEAMKINYESPNSTFELAKALGHPCIVRKGKEDIISSGFPDQFPSLSSSLTTDSTDPLSVNLNSSFITVNQQGSLRRAGGQGDILAGSITALLSWIECQSKSYWGEKCTLQEKQNLIPFYVAAGCYFARLASNFVWQKFGRSMVTSDIVTSLPEVVRVFESKINQEKRQVK